LLAANNFSFGVLTPVLGYIMSCLGAFIGLRCTTRAYAYAGAARARWLTLAAVSIGTTGCWVMHFIGMLGYTIPGMTIRYNVPITIGSMLIAVVVVAIGLFIVGFGKPTWPNLLIAGTFTGIGVASMHYTGMAALEIPATMSYQSGLFGLSVVIGIVAATAALWAALRLRGLWSTLGASLIMGVAVSGMHYTGMAAMNVRRPAGPVIAATGATAEGFLLPLIIGIGVVSIIMTGVLVFSPTETEIREDQELMQRINEATSRLASAPSLPTTPGPTARWNGAAPARSGYSGQNGYAGQNGAPGAPESGPAGAQDLSRRHRRIGRVSRPEEPDQRLAGADQRRLISIG
jgi:NO-binding membrane sensor protein with MHYT domain